MSALEKMPKATEPKRFGHAPNVVVVLLDDMGFGASSAFGGPCEIPGSERLAQSGLLYNQFHTTGIRAMTCPRTW